MPIKYRCLHDAYTFLTLTVTIAVRPTIGESDAMIAALADWAVAEMNS